MRSIYVRIALAGLATTALACSDPAPINYDGPTAAWHGFGGGHDGLRYSPLMQIDASNVEDLEVMYCSENDCCN